MLILSSHTTQATDHSLLFSWIGASKCHGSLSRSHKVSAARRLSKQGEKWKQMTMFTIISQYWLSEPEREAHSTEGRRTKIKKTASEKINTSLLLASESYTRINNALTSPCNCYHSLLSSRVCIIFTGLSFFQTGELFNWALVHLCTGWLVRGYHMCCDRVHRKSTRKRAALEKKQETVCAATWPCWQSKWWC